MDTKNVLVFLAGAAVAYFVITQIEKNKKNVPATQPIVDDVDPKLAACQASLAEALKTVKTSDIEGYKSQYMTDCMGEPIQPVYGNQPMPTGALDYAPSVAGLEGIN